MADLSGALIGEKLELLSDTPKKNGNPRTPATVNRYAATLKGSALELIKKHRKIRRIDTDLLFPAMKGDKPIDIRESWLYAVDQAKLTDFKFHDLRHTAASYLTMNGATLPELAEILGHKTLAMVKRYAHLSESHTHSVIAKMNERYLGE